MKDQSSVVSRPSSAKALTAFLTLLLLAGCGSGNSKKGQGGGLKPVTVTRDDMEITVLATGNVQPKNQLYIKPPIAGRVEKIFIQEGAFVRKGQILVELSSTERAALLDVARAQGPEALAKWQDMYLPTPLLSPLSGQIVSLPTVPGQAVGTGDTIMVMSDHLIVSTQVDETDLAQIKLNQKALVTLDAYPGQPVNASVKRIAFQSTLVNNVTMYQVEVWPDKVPPSMRSGMTANVVFQVAEKPGVLVLPSEAVQQRGERSIVLLAGAKASDKPTPQPVETGLTDGKMTEIVSGLKEGDRVMVKTFSAGQVAQPNAGANPFMPSGNTRTGGGQGGGGNRGGRQ